MRRILTTLVTGATVIALATPATVSAAADRDDSTTSSKSSLPAAVAVPANAAPGKTQLRSSIDRAVSTVFESTTSAGQQPGPVTRKGKTTVRAQGGGGKTGMIIGLVSTVVGLAVTVYMVKAMQDNTKELTKDLQRQR
jgi:hypothetical protein